MVVAASIRNQRSDDGFALLKRDNTARTSIGVAIDESALAGREVISRQGGKLAIRAFIVRRAQIHS